jgi:tryptophan synthase beta chain
MEALDMTMKKEGIIPALESAHGFVQAFKEASDLGRDEALIINMSGRGDKDIFTIAKAYGDPSWQEFIIEQAEQYRKDKK